MTLPEPNAPGWWSAVGPYGQKAKVEVRKVSDGMECRTHGDTRWHYVPWVIANGWSKWKRCAEPVNGK